MNPKVIVCTGGIGSGKTDVTTAFSALGYPVYNCDVRAKDLYDEDPALLKKVADIAGNDILKNGKLDRAALAEKIFKDNDSLQRIERVVHPAVIEDFEKWKKSQNSPIVIFESALYFEKKNLHSLSDYVILMTASEEVRVQRVVKRDSISEQQVRQRMANQLPDSAKIPKADWVIDTDDKHPVLPQILNIIDKITNNGKNRS
ncbi:MAG: dephospho-CoA kinase [Bacteroidales bacterium]|nr:dephospho-CoA kinase [Bacteroidales bacterium]